MRRWTRRALLGAALAGGAIGVPVRGWTRGSRRVLVVGAGLAGLSAAYELDRAGHDVLVLEAQARPGGRVLTLREPFDDDLYADAGAARIHLSHEHALIYADHFGLTLEPFYPSADGFLSHTATGTERVGWEGFRTAVRLYRGLDLGESGHWVKIRGGNDRLATAFAAGLGERVKFRQPVLSVVEHAGHVEVRFGTAGHHTSVEADRVVLAVPFSVIGNIEIEAPFSDAKREAIERLSRYDPACRVFVQLAERPWLEQGLNGFGVSHFPAEFWPSSFGQAGPRSVLQLYVVRGGAEWVTSLGPQQRILFALEHLEQPLTGLARRFEHGVSKCWGEDPWVRGGWANHYGVRTHYAAASRPEGRFHFAGEHVSTAQGWMEGALQAGLRAAAEIGVAAG